MRNLWIQIDDPFVTWIADFTAIARKPTQILRFVQAAMTSGVRHRVFDVAEAPLIGYVRDRDGALDDVIGRLFTQDQVLDLFGFTGAAMLPGLPRSSTVETTLCHYDRNDQLVERIVTDLGAVLSHLEPVPDCIYHKYMAHYPAVRITGRQYRDIREGKRVDRSAHPLPIEVRICIHSDIWFPWVDGTAHPAWVWHDQRMFDNRELANRHTPRLNAFLREVAEAARQIGGQFSIRADETRGQAINWADDEGVLLDWMPPGGIMPPEALEVEWG
jgi:hypothetical protein